VCSFLIEGEGFITSRRVVYSLETFILTEYFADEIIIPNLPGTPLYLRAISRIFARQTGCLLSKEDNILISVEVFFKMDPMSIAEEERRLKEESELRELHETVALDENYFAARDLSGKGRDVHTTARQRKFVQKEASTIKFNVNNRRRSGGMDDCLDADDGSTVEIDFNTKPRTFVAKGFVNRYEPGR
jgi:AAA15 family ATPase/GTPase